MASRYYLKITKKNITITAFDERYFEPSSFSKLHDGDVPMGAIKVPGHAETWVSTADLFPTQEAAAKAAEKRVGDQVHLAAQRLKDARARLQKVIKHEYIQRKREPK